MNCIYFIIFYDLIVNFYDFSIEINVNLFKYFIYFDMLIYVMMDIYFVLCNYHNLINFYCYYKNMNEMDCEYD